MPRQAGLNATERDSGGYGIERQPAWAYRRSFGPGLKGLTSRIPPRRTCADYLQKWTATIAIIGYARVSMQDPDFARQVEALKAAGATRIHREKVSGAGADPRKRR